MSVLFGDIRKSSGALFIFRKVNVFHFSAFTHHVDPQTFLCPQVSPSEKTENKCVLKHELKDCPIKYGRKSIEREMSTGRAGQVARMTKNCKQKTSISSIYLGST